MTRCILNHHLLNNVTTCTNFGIRILLLKATIFREAGGWIV